MTTLSPLFTWRTAVARSELRSTAKLIAFALSLYMSERGDSCYPSIESLAGDTSTSRSTVSGAIKTLIDEGWLERKSGGGRGRSTRYTALVGETAREPGGLETARLSAKPLGSPTETAREPSATTSGPRQGTTPTRAARPRDQLFDELATRCGWDLSAMTKDSSRLCAVATAEIRKAGGTVEMIGLAVATYQRLYNGAAVTPKAIANHWPKIAPRAKSPAQVVCPECNIGGGLHLSDCPTLTPA